MYQLHKLDNDDKLQQHRSMVRHVISFRKGNRQPINNIRVQTINCKGCSLLPPLSFLLRMQRQSIRLL